MKAQIIEALLTQGRMVSIALETRGCVLPKSVMSSTHATLQVGYDMPIPIPDLRLTGKGFTATLSFDRTSFTVSVPWSAVYSAWDEYGTLVQWQDVPGKVEQPTEPLTHKGEGAKVLSFADFKNRSKK